MTGLSAKHETHLYRVASSRPKDPGTAVSPGYIGPTHLAQTNGWSDGASREIYLSPLSGRGPDHSILQGDGFLRTYSASSDQCEPAGVFGTLIQVVGLSDPIQTREQAPVPMHPGICREYVTSDAFFSLSSRTRLELALFGEFCVMTA